MAEPASPIPGIATIIAEIMAHGSATERCITENKTRLFPLLAAAGIATITVEYEGSGDSGAVENITIVDAEGNPMPLPAGEVTMQSPNWNGKEISEHPAAIDVAVENLAMDAVECRHGGWENNEGGRGSITLDIAGNRIEVEHIDLVESFDAYEL